jgi:hypothetical protein
MAVDKDKLNRVLVWGTLLAIPLLGAGSCLPSPSDRRFKRDIAKIGPLNSDIDLYRYKYLWSEQEYVGVMAQELREVRPDAVLEDGLGYLAVDYAKLGTRLRTFGDWQQAHR